MTGVDLSDMDRVESLEHAVDGLRRLTELLNRVDDDDPALAAVAQELEHITGLLARGGESRTLSATGDPVCGRENALAPPLTMEIAADGTVTATGSLGLPYQGPRGLVHGGMSALMLDHVLGTTQSLCGGPSVIEELSVRYHQPLPLFEEVVSTCRQTERDGCRIRARGEITVNGRIAVSADALFARPKVLPAAQDA